MTDLKPYRLLLVVLLTACGCAKQAPKPTPTPMPITPSVTVGMGTPAYQMCAWISTSSTMKTTYIKGMDISVPPDKENEKEREKDGWVHYCAILPATDSSYTCEPLGREPQSTEERLICARSAFSSLLRDDLHYESVTRKEIDSKDREIARLKAELNPTPHLRAKTDDDGGTTVEASCPDGWLVHITPEAEAAFNNKQDRATSDAVNVLADGTCVRKSKNSKLNVYNVYNWPAKVKP